MTIDQIKAANKAAGYCFFDRDTMRFFRSRVSEQTYGRYFVTSDQNSSMRFSYPRLYTVRVARPNGDIDTVGEFQAHTTLKRALTAAKNSHIDACGY